jgi:hypothetical protein
MALSARMLALIQKIEAADEAHFAGLRETAKREAQTRTEATKKKMQARRAARGLESQRATP